MEPVRVLVGLCHDVLRLPCYWDYRMPLRNDKGGTCVDVVPHMLEKDLICLRKW